MARAHIVTYALDSEGRPIGGATVRVYEPGTTTSIAQTIYAADSPSMVTKANPFTSDADGRIEFYLDNPQFVDLNVSKVGYDTKTIRQAVIQLTSSALVLEDGGTPVTQRNTIDFQNGFILNDNGAAPQTEINLDYAGTAELADVTSAENAGASSKVPRGDHVHAHGVIASGDHHTEYVQESAHTAAAHDSLAMSHDSLSGVSANDHHTQSHTHNADGSGAVDHGSLTGLTDDDHTQYLKEKASGGTASETPTHTHADAANAGTVSHDVLTGVDANDHHNDLHRADKHSYVGVVASAGSESIPDATEDTLQFSGEVIDTDLFHSTSSNQERLTVTAPFNNYKVRVRCRGIWTANSTGRRELRIYHKTGGGVGADVKIGHSTMTAASAVAVGHECFSAAVIPVTGDYFYATAFQNSGGAMSLDDVYFEMEVLGT